MSTTLENLISQLSGYQPYTPLSEAEIRSQATQRYQSVYDQKRLSAQQSYEIDDAALARELSGLQKSFDQQRTSSAAQTRSTYSQADRHALSRGMQRSSYNEANLTNISLAGDAALRAIDQDQTDREADIAQQRTLLSNQLSQTLKQLTVDQQNDILAYMDELAAREYDRAFNSQNAYTQLALQLYEYQHELELEAAEQARWQAEFDAKYGGTVSRTPYSSKKTTEAEVQQPALAAVPVSGVRKNQQDLMI